VSEGGSRKKKGGFVRLTLNNLNAVGAFSTWPSAAGKERKKTSFERCMGPEKKGEWSGFLCSLPGRGFRSGKEHKPSKKTKEPSPQISWGKGSGERERLQKGLNELCVEDIHNLNPKRKKRNRSKDLVLG